MVLLEVVAPAGGVDDAVQALAGGHRVEDVHDPSAVVLHLEDAHAAERARVPGLAAALGVERGAVEHDRGPSPVLPALHDACVELEQVRVVAVEEDGVVPAHHSGAMFSMYLKRGAGVED